MSVDDDEEDDDELYLDNDDDDDDEEVSDKLKSSDKFSYIYKYIEDLKYLNYFKLI